MNATLRDAFTNRRGRSPVGNLELYAWFFLRISGVVLLGLAVFHLLYMHLAVGVDNMDFDLVAARWANPFWKIFDLFLLVFALSHGMTGLRLVIDDYIHHPGWLAAVKSAAFVAYVFFLGIGAYIIFTFVPPIPGMIP
jgi:succinate dehydrogenase / fumarate reductase membrane anchor subunit